MAAHVQKFIDLCEQYKSMHLLLYAQHSLPGEQAAYQRIGRIEMLAWAAEHLRSLNITMKPVTWLPRIEALLDALEENKVAWLVNSIRERRANGLNQLAEYRAEGAIAQIDGIVEQVLALLPRKWHETSSRRNGRFFHVYQSLMPDVLINKETGVQRWFGPECEQCYQEVALLQVKEPENQLASVYKLTSRPGWHQSQEVMWVRKNPPERFGKPAAPFIPRLTEAGDVLVSALTGAAWMVADVGFVPLVQPEPEREVEHGHA